MADKPKAKPKKKQEPEVQVTDSMLLTRVDANGKKWFGAIGKKEKGGIMFVFQSPRSSEANMNAPFSERQAQLVGDAIRATGIDVSDCYMTYAIKYAIYRDKPPKATEKKECRPVLDYEIAKYKPRVIVTMGTPAFDCVYTGKKKVKVSDYMVTPIPHPKYPDSTIIPIYSPGYVMRNPQFKSQFFADIAKCIGFYHGEDIKTSADVNYMVVDSREKLVELADRLSSEQIGDIPGLDEFIVPDIETGGGRWPHDGKSYMRTVQLGWRSDASAVIKLYPCGHYDREEGKNQEGCCPWDDFVEFMHWFYEMGFKLCGHNGRYDLRYIKREGIDLRNRYVYDTMLAEHIIDNTMTFSLNDMALRYTTLGKYDAEVLRFKSEHPELVNDGEGYGMIPDDILFPYGAADVIAPRTIFHKQLTRIGPFCKRRGHHQQYESLLSQEILTAMDLIDIEDRGIPCDVKQADKLARAYADMKATLANDVAVLVGTRYPDIGTDFNCRSVDQMRRLLFSDDGLNLVPVQTTDKPPKPWEWVMRQRKEIQKHHAPSTGMDSLKILYDQTQDPILKKVVDYRQIDQVCKNFLRLDGSGGINGNIWPDGRIHASFSQLSDTGRFRSGNPNVQNWSKQAERFYAKIFEEANKKVDKMRSIVLAPPGWFIVEADYKQAELFTLAGLSGDMEMMGALTTPGRDLHDEVTIKSFGYQVLHDNGTPVDDNEMQALAVENFDEFENLQGKFTYITQSGERMTRAEFKAGPRTAGKAVNFGIPYVVTSYISFCEELKSCELLGNPTRAISSQAA